MSNKKTIYLLLGPKGSGKSFIGNLFHEHFGIPFLRVEDFVKEIRNDRDITNELYRVEAFATIESAVREFLEKHNLVVFESIGLTTQFDRMLDSLLEDYNIITIKIEAASDLCLQRFKTRNKTIHITVSDDKLNMIYDEFVKRNMQTDFIIDNNNKTKEQLIPEIEQIINNK